MYVARRCSLCLLEWWLPQLAPHFFVPLLHFPHHCLFGHRAWVLFPSRVVKQPVLCQYQTHRGPPCTTGDFRMSRSQSYIQSCWALAELLHHALKSASKTDVQQLWKSSQEPLLWLVWWQKDPILRMWYKAQAVDSLLPKWTYRVQWNCTLSLLTASFHSKEVCMKPSEKIWSLHNGRLEWVDIDCVGLQQPNF